MSHFYGLFASNRATHASDTTYKHSCNVRQFRLEYVRMYIPSNYNAVPFELAARANGDKEYPILVPKIQLDNPWQTNTIVTRVCCDSTHSHKVVSCYWKLQPLNDSSAALAGSDSVVLHSSFFIVTHKVSDEYFMSVARLHVSSSSYSIPNCNYTLDERKNNEKRNYNILLWVNSCRSFDAICRKSNRIVIRCACENRTPCRILIILTDIR